MKMLIDGFIPAILVDVPTDMPVMKEEVFGPIIPIYQFSNHEEAMEIANSTKFGLQVSVITPDITKALKAAYEIDPIEK